VTRQFTAEATAIFRRTGTWSVSLGPGGFLERFYLRRPVSPAPELERRLGVLATCLGNLLASTLEGAGISNHGIRATVQCASHRQADSQSQELRIESHVFVECEADQNAVQARYEARLRTDPMVLLLTQDIHAMDVRVTVHSSISIRIA
jgi:hypothetical protein